MAPKRGEFEQEMMMLEGEIKRLEAEYNMFFAGRLPRLPWETRDRVEKLIKRYDRMNINNTADRYRFSTVQARFNSFCKLWERHLKEREEGRAQPGRARVAVPVVEAPPSSDAAEERLTLQADRTVHATAIRNPSEDAQQLKALYQRLSDARQENGEQPLPYERFTAVVKAQMSKLSASGEPVSFRVVVKDGKVTMSANKE